MGHLRSISCMACIVLVHLLEDGCQLQVREGDTGVDALDESCQLSLHSGQQTFHSSILLYTVTYKRGIRRAKRDLRGLDIAISGTEDGITGVHKSPATCIGQQA